MTKFAYGRSFLEAHPKFFSLGTVTKTGPTRKMIKNTHFFTEIIGKWWDKDSPDEPRSSPTKIMVIKVTGNQSPYLATSTCLVQSALTLLEDLKKMSNGLVYS